MASMEDLVATISSNLQAGPQGNDLRDLHAKLTQTIHQQPHYRPIPPSSTSSDNIPATHSNNVGPLPPPAPASSWNSPLPPSTLNNPNLNPALNASPSAGTGTSPIRQSGWIANKRQTGFNVSSSSPSFSSTNNQNYGVIPMPKNNGSGAGNGIRIQNGSKGEGGLEERPYHANVLPIKASPKDTGGFSEDAFKPLWGGATPDEDSRSRNNGNNDWRGFNGRK